MERNLAEGTLLWVEDHEVTRHHVGAALSLYFPALIVVAAADGLQGVELYRMHRPDLILTDLDMPRMNGIRMVRAIRGLGYTGEVIMITARARPDLIGALDRCGINCSLAKPLLLKELVAAVAERLPPPPGAARRKATNE